MQNSIEVGDRGEGSLLPGLYLTQELFKSLLWLSAYAVFVLALSVVNKMPISIPDQTHNADLYWPALSKCVTPLLLFVSPAANILGLPLQ